MRRIRFIAIALVLVVLLGFSYPSLTQAQSQTHTVQPGENLFRIALQYGVTVEAIMAANNLVDPSRIYAGQVLTIPAPGSPAPPAANNSPPPANTAPVYHIVQPGETLASISRAFGVSLQALITANNIYDVNHIEVGQRLIIPGVNAPAGGATLPNVPVVGQPAAPTAVPPTAAPAPAAGTYRTHVVQPGQGLAAIARLYGTTWPAIAALNGITDPNTIYAGTILKIPPAGSSGTGMDPSTGSPPGPLGVNIPVTGPGSSGAGKSITVVLHEQRVYAYENGALVRNVLASTGLPGTPTVIGTFHIYVKYSAQLMVGPGYYLPGVPWVMYFYQGYALHGTYWHSNWGHPMSYGCVNLPTPEALWFYNWAPMGTTVTVVW